MALGTGLPAIAVVGANLDRGTGSVALFAGAGADVQPLFTLVPDDARPGDEVGFAAAIDGDLLAVGAPGSGGERGAVHLYRLAGQGAPRRLARLDGTARGGRFGHALALRDGLLAVGAPSESGPAGSLAGAVHLFTIGREGTVRQAGRLAARSGGPFDGFGSSLGLGGGLLTLLAVGSPFRGGPAGGNQGAVTLFRETGGRWEEVGELSAGTEARAGDQLGDAVAVSGETVAAGARRADAAGEDSGAVWVFDLASGGRERLVASDGSPGDLFGEAVALAGGRLAAGAAAADDREPGAGAVYLFERGPGGWREVRKLPGREAGSGYGQAVALNEETVLAGAFLQGGTGAAESCRVKEPSEPEEPGELALRVEAPAVAVPGRRVKLALTVENTGGTALQGVRVSLAVPWLVRTRWTCAPSGGATCAGGSGPTFAATAELPAGGRARYEVTALVDPALACPCGDPGRVGGTATATSAEGAAATAPLAGARVRCEADLSVTASAAPPVVSPPIGLAWTVTVTNNDRTDCVAGARVAVDVRPPLPGLAWTCQPAGGASCGRPGAEGRLADRPTLPPGSRVVYRIAGLSTPGETVAEAEVRPPGWIIDPRPENDRAVAGAGEDPGRE